MQYLETFPQWLTKILRDLVNTNAAHRSDGQGSNERICILTILGGNEKVRTDNHTAS